MRTIKFRAWDREWRKYFDCTLMVLSWGQGGEHRLRVKVPAPELEGAWVDAIAENRFDVEQYTGLKDKNGKEIYEGDILMDYPDEFNEIVKPSKVIVEWFGACFFFRGVDGGHGGFWVSGTSSEVIGNIHENPELLK